MEEVSPITRFAIRMGGSCRYKLTFPGVGEDELYFIIRPPSNQAVRTEMASAGLRLVKEDGEVATQLKLWPQFLARADAQIVDFVVPAFNGETGAALPSRRFSLNLSNNHEVYATLPTETKQILETAMLTVAGDEDAIGEEDRAAWESLKNEHSELLMPLAKV